LIAKLMCSEIFCCVSSFVALSGILDRFQLFFKWASVGSVSTMDQLVGLPFNNIKSISEGILLPEATEYTSTGDIYFCMSDLDQTAEDILSYNHVSVSLSEEQTPYCRERGWDAEDPRCGRLVFNGPMIRV